jgi:formylglycine-generating enzyme required for sulfatase activity
MRIPSMSDAARLVSLLCAVTACGSPRVSEVPSARKSALPTPQAAGAEQSSDGSAKSRSGSAQGEPMVRIPKGTFLMGAREGEGTPVGRPEHSVTVEQFELDVTEVTVAAYTACVRAGACDARHLNEDPECNYEKNDKLFDPINCVDWFQSARYCQAQDKRLPTEVEWEYAARGGAEGRVYSWGNEAPGTQLCWSGSDTRQGTCPVDSFPRGAFGLADMTGNVWEWTSSHLSKDYRSERSGQGFVTRGGSWNIGLVESFSATYRTDARPTDRYDFLGFRCARSNASSAASTPAASNNRMADATKGRVVSLVVKESAGRLEIVNSTEFAAEELPSDRSSWNGPGTPRYRWRLLDRVGRMLDSGEIAYNSVSHTPLEPGRPPVHVQRDPVFLVRAPAPGTGQSIEISSLDGSISPVIWRQVKQISSPK